MAVGSAPFFTLEGRGMNTEQVVVINRRSVMWGVFWGMTLFFLILCVPFGIFLAVQSHDDPVGLRQDREMAQALVKVGYVGQFKCLAAEYRSDIDTFAGLGMMEQDRMVTRMMDLGTVFRFSGNARVIDVDYGDHMTRLGPPAMRVYYVQMRVTDGSRAGETLWGLLTSLNDPTNSK